MNRMPGSGKKGFECYKTMITGLFKFSLDRGREHGGPMVETRLHHSLTLWPCANYIICSPGDYNKFYYIYIYIYNNNIINIYIINNNK